ncbi:MAG TPA: cytochrome c biogenesis protein ResB [Mariprofundaceae bacterium]|nr:cytochrome c biogenesis protein ResB [Mariprofundaceae bacterium]
MPSFADLLKNLWTRLGSMSLAIILLVVLSVASVIGTVLLQNQDQTDYLQQFGPLWYWVFRSLGLFDMYHTWWFLSLLGFLMLSLSACLWRNVPRMLKEMRGRKATLPEKTFKHMQMLQQWRISANERETLEKQLRHELRGWEFVTAEAEGQHYIRADKGRWNKWGYISVHTAILIILIGGMISVEFGIRGNMSVPEGQSANSISFLKGGQDKTMTMPFSVRCNSFSIQFFPTGAPKEFRSNLTIIDGGKEVLTKDIIVNEPLYYKGVRIYQASFGDGGSAIGLKLYHLDGSAEISQAKTKVYKTYTDQATGVTLEITDFKPFNVENLANPGEPKDFKNLGPAVEFVMRGPGLKPVKVKSFMNPFVGRDGVNRGSFMLVSLTGDAKDYQPFSFGIDLTNPQEWQLFHDFMRELAQRSDVKDPKQRNLEAFKAALTDVFGDKRPEGFQQMAERMLQAIQMLPQIPWPFIPMLDDFDQVYYTGLQLAEDPGMNVVWAGSAILVIGLCLMFYMPHRKLWLVLKPEGDAIQVSLAAMTTRNAMAFEQTFNALFTKLAKGTPTQA